MKKISLIISLFVFVLGFSQTNFGVKAGYSNANMKWKINGSDEKFDSKSFFYIGILGEYSFNEKVSLQGEVLFSQVGGKIKKGYYVPVVGYDGLVYAGSGITDVRINQIQIPVSGKFYFIPKHLSASIGINFGLNVSSETKVETPIDQKEIIKDNFKTVSLFPFIGTEYKFNKNFFGEARYNFGFINLGKSGRPETEINFFQIGIGYTFN